MKRTTIYTQIITLMLTLIFFTISLNINTFAGSTKIKVGYVDIDKFLEVTPNGTASGYMAEYLQKISEYNGWEYEYVHDTWSNCLTMLKNGEIDLLMPAEYTEERAKDFLFSNERCCMDYTSLVGLKNDDRFYYDDFSAFNGMTVGIIKDNFLNNTFTEYATLHNFTVNYKEYPNSTTLNEALANKEVDAIVNGNMNFFHTQKLLAKINYMPAYFITSKNKPEIMEELNNALKDIQLENPYYVSNLHQKYYGKIEKQSIGFTREENDFIKNTDKITVICERNHFPLEYYNKTTHQPDGIYVHILNLIAEQSNLKFEYLCPPNDSVTGWELIQQNKGQILASAVDTPVLSELYNLNFSDSYIQIPYVALRRTNSNVSLNDDLNVGILTSSPGLEEITARTYKNWNFKRYETNEKSLKALINNDVDIVIINTYVLENIKNTSLSKKVSQILTTTFFVPISIGVSKTQNPVLLSVVKKSILKIDNNEIETAIQSYYNSRADSLLAFIERHSLATVCVLAIFIILLILVLFLIYTNRLKSKQNTLLLNKNKELEAASLREEYLRQKIQIDKLTGLYDKITTEQKCTGYIKIGYNGSLVLIDIDNFKDINDTYGHKAGDEYIVKISQAINIISRSDDITGRIGGDEFIIFFKGLTDKKVLEAKLNQFLSIIRNDLDLRRENSSCSIGAVLVNDTTKNFNYYYNLADTAMYIVKNKGKDDFHIL